MCYWHLPCLKLMPCTLECLLTIGADFAWGLLCSLTKHVLSEHFSDKLGCTT